MDKFTKVVEKIVSRADPKDREEIQLYAGVVADVLRGVEQIGQDIDRIATALEIVAKVVPAR